MRLTSPLCVHDVKCRELDETGRQKHAILIGPHVLEGLRAAKSILKGYKRVPERMRHFNEMEEFQKRGSFIEAWDDFHSVDPQDITETGIPGQMRLVGKIGDRTLILQQRGLTDEPSLEIVKGAGTAKLNIDLILYRKFP